jgi:hypothetical protein
MTYIVPKFSLDYSSNIYLLKENFVYNYINEYIVIYRKYNDTVSDDGRYHIFYSNKLEVIGIYNALTKTFYIELNIVYHQIGYLINLKKKIYVGKIIHAETENLNNYFLGNRNVPTYFSKLSDLYHEYNFLTYIHYTGKYTRYFLFDYYSTHGKKFIYREGTMKDGHPDGLEIEYETPPIVMEENDIEKFDERYKLYETCICTWNGTETVRTNVVKYYDETLFYNDD